MNQQFITFNGLITFGEEHITIRDGKSIWLKIMIMVFMLFLSVTGVYLAASFFTQQPPPSAGILIWGTVFSITGTMVLVKMITSSWLKKIGYGIIRKAVFRKGRSGYFFLDLIIPAGRKRSIILDVNDQFGFGQHSLARLRETLLVKNISTEEEGIY